MNYLCKVIDGAHVAVITDEKGAVLDTSAPFVAKHSAMDLRDRARNEGVSAFADIGKDKPAAPTEVKPPQPAVAAAPAPVVPVAKTVTEKPVLVQKPAPVRKPRAPKAKPKPEPPVAASKKRH